MKSVRLPPESAQEVLTVRPLRHILHKLRLCFSFCSKIYLSQCPGAHTRLTHAYYTLDILVKEQKRAKEGYRCATIQDLRSEPTILFKFVAIRETENSKARKMG